jgi:hypothetical protein
VFGAPPHLRQRRVELLKEIPDELVPPGGEIFGEAWFVAGAVREPANVWPRLEREHDLELRFGRPAAHAANWPV